MITLFSQPWLITDESFGAMCKIAEQFEMLANQPDGTRAMVSPFQPDGDGEDDLMVGYGIGIIAINGPLVKKPDRV